MYSFDFFKNKQEKICVVGLGYVGLPLAISLAKHFSVIGFDVKKDRIEELRSGFDRTKEVSDKSLADSRVEYSFEPSIIRNCKFIIVAVPTPVDKNNLPDLSLVEKATIMVGQNLSSGSVVVYESTVYPGVTEDICLPLLEKNSGLNFGVDFKIGYSPERINPGDKEHTIERITKIVSASDSESLDLVAMIYGQITKVFKASSIKVAEAAKVIENTQRDVNIALMNELAVIFSKLGISTYEVLEAAGTKWNFLNFKPGLVGGHCIGVDPYYLTFKSQELGYEPEVILSGRKTNDGMASFVVNEINRCSLLSGKTTGDLKVLIFGMTFKENVPDVRNTKVVDIYKEFQKLGVKLQIYDPLAYEDEVKSEYDLDLSKKEDIVPCDILVLAVAHDDFKKELSDNLSNYLLPGGLLADVKKIFSKEEILAKGFAYWTL